MRKEIFLSGGLSKATKINEGRKIPSVAAITPQNPLSCQPINVAVDKSEPGVNYSTATAFINCSVVNDPVLTNSASKNANNT